MISVVSHDIIFSDTTPLFPCIFAYHHPVAGLFYRVEEAYMCKTEFTNLLLTLPEELKERLQQKADKQHRTLNGYIVWLLANRLKNEKPE